jgi:nuclear pore complex protein Nup133
VLILTTAGLFDKDSTIKPMSPRDVLGACTEELDERFAGLDASIRDSIVRDMQVEDENLKPFIETSRLEKWYHAALELARDDFKLELDEQTDDGEKMKQAEKTLAEIEEGIKENEKRKAEGLLHSKPRYKLKSKVSGSLGNFRSSIKQY